MGEFFRKLLAVFTKNKCLHLEWQRINLTFYLQKPMQCGAMHDNVMYFFHFY